jgi:hypothetical protein
MGCVSAGTEQDAGTRYPTVIQDSNGNQILLTYKSGIGTAWDNSSARIWRVDDVRSVFQADGYRTYQMGYYTQTLPHLSSINSYIGTPSYEFYYTASPPLTSPFTPQISFGSTTFLTSVVQSGTGLTHGFQYNSSGEMTGVTFPLGGNIEWLYRDFTYLGDRTIREVYRRNLTATSGGPSTAHLIWRHDEVDPGGTLHYLTVLWDWDDTPARTITRPGRSPIRPASGTRGFFRDTRKGRPPGRPPPASRTTPGRKAYRTTLTFPLC